MRNLVKEFRARDGLSQQELADRLGVSRQTIISIEKGRYSPSLALAFAIARVFSSPVEGIFQDDNP